MKRDSALVRLTWWGYQLLLFLYPRAYRREFGREMSLALRDYCRQTAEHKGPFGVLQIWLTMGVDLLATVLLEHLLEVKEMPLRSLTRFLGIIGLLGGIYAAIIGIVWFTFGSSGEDSLPFLPFYIIAIGIGCLGLFLKSADLGSQARLGAAVAFAGMALAGLGMALMFLLQTGGDGGWILWYLGANVLHPIGLIAFGLGLVGWGRFWKTVPIAAGSLVIFFMLLSVTLEREQFFGLAMLALGSAWVLIYFMPLSEHGRNPVYDL